MKNVTITLNEALESFARLTAAKHSKSLSRFISDLLSELKERTEKKSYALEEFLSEQPYLRTSGKRISREEIYDRKVFS